MNKINSFIILVFVIVFVILIILGCAKCIAEISNENLCIYFDYDTAIWRPDKGFTVDCQKTIYTPLDELLDK